MANESSPDHVRTRELTPILDSAKCAALDGADGVLTALLPQFETRARLLGTTLVRQ